MMNKNMLRKALSDALKYTAIALLLLVVSAQMYDYIQSEPWKQISQQALFDTVSKELSSVTNLTPGESIKQTKMELLNQTNKEATASLIVTTDKKVYKYLITADGKYGLSYLFGWNSLKTISIMTESLQ